MLPSAGAFHPLGFKALGEPQGRAAAAPREQGESERRQPPDSHGCWGLSLMFRKALERRMKGAGGVWGGAERQQGCSHRPRLSPPRVGPGIFLTYFPLCHRTGCARCFGEGRSGHRESPGCSCCCSKGGDAPDGYQVRGSAPLDASPNWVPLPGMTSCTPWHRMTSLYKPSRVMPLDQLAPRAGDCESLRGEQGAGWGARVTVAPLAAETIQRFIHGLVHLQARFSKDYIIVLGPSLSTHQRCIH